MKVIDHIEVGAGGASSITFMNVGDIPSDYTDLMIVLSGRTTAANVQTNIFLTFNGSTSGFSERLLYGTGSGTGSNAGPSTASIRFLYGSGASSTSSTFSNSSIYIPNYRAAASKSVSIDSVTENNATAAFQNITAGLWANTNPITSITLAPESSNFVQYSSATLYGIRKYNTSLAPKASGGIISYDSVNNKWVHVFTASGTFTPTENLSGVEYLVVAGGGGGGGGLGGGGGAGGYRSSVTGESSGGGASAESTLSLTASTNYTVTVGAGGSSNTYTVNNSITNGSNSVFDTITATGGGYGGWTNTSNLAQNAASGGSGGGGAGAGGGKEVGQAGTANQGYAGGNGVPTIATLNGAGGGGGGAGSVGSAAVAPAAAGNGGSGISSSITGSSVARAGGGGGGARTSASGTAGTATAGGGAGTSTDTNATDGAVNSGGGGGGYGGLAAYKGGNGGSGIVIVRYSA